MILSRYLENLGFMSHPKMPILKIWVSCLFYIYWPSLPGGCINRVIRLKIHFENAFLANLAFAVQLMPHLHCCVYPLTPKQNAQPMSFVQTSRSTPLFHLIY